MHHQVQHQKNQMDIYPIHFLIEYIHVLLHQVTKQYQEPIQVMVVVIHMDPKVVVITVKY